MSAFSVKAPLSRTEQRARLRLSVLLNPSGDIFFHSPHPLVSQPFKSPSSLQAWHVQPNTPYRALTALQRQSEVTLRGRKRANNSLWSCCHSCRVLMKMRMGRTRTHFYIKHTGASEEHLLLGLFLCFVQGRRVFVFSGLTALTVDAKGNRD